MRKFQIFICFLAMAVFVAGAFGAIHDQISYTVSDEYFTKFKFFQFGFLNPDIPERLRAAAVGFLASWWMGIPLGLLTGVAGFVHPSPSQMKSALFWSLPIITGVTLAVALTGLSYGYSQTQNLSLAAYGGWYIPKNLEHTRAFLCAGYMHNSAYLGGLLSIPVAWAFHFLYWRNHAASAA